MFDHVLSAKEKDLLGLIQLSASQMPRCVLNEELIGPVCERHGWTREQFLDEFAVLVALDFVRGDLSYAGGDHAMNDLRAFAHMDYRFDGFALRIYEAFDAGEYDRPGDPDDVVPWQKYTLPEVMDALRERGLLCR
ncbi:hypothetical protein K4L06_15255 [Lysobacter sp. BMK333-48F3]|uniref:hypothetical protein n=1 Tax=Lysobacter sp. BMK333-48F3 TaxID=2867962 RepID=UPI001C8C779B|nr:hypothetical protein [Lysobacter sp. BMK333-48F3]MBX9402666.1 hypothetical protein [Lysobacter sp. BMK333-48F3]